MTDFPLWVDGRLRDPDARCISPRDPGFLLGLACFETLLLEDQCLYFVSEHLERLESSASGLDIEWPPRWDLEQALELYCDPLRDRGSIAIRVTLSPGAPGAGPSVVIDSRARPLPDPAGVEVILCERQRLVGFSLAALKSTSRAAHVLARARAEASGAWEALLGTDEGDVAEGSASNVFVVRDGVAFTPPLDRGLLAGIVRDKLVHELGDGEVRIVEERVRPEDLSAADEVFLSSSLARILPVRAVRGVREDLPGAAGAVTRHLAERFRALEARYRAARAH